MTQTEILPAARFTRVLRALVTQFVAGIAVGSEWTFMIAPGADVVAWVPRAGHLVLQLVDESGRTLRTVTVCPGLERPYEVVAADRLILTETRGVGAAISVALDYLVAPLRAGRQHEHDACAV